MDKKKLFLHLLVGSLFFFGTFGVFLAILTPLGVSIVPIIGMEEKTGWDAVLWSFIISIALGLIFPIFSYMIIEIGHHIRRFFGGKKRPPSVIGDGDDEPAKDED